MLEDPPQAVKTHLVGKRGASVGGKGATKHKGISSKPLDTSARNDQLRDTRKGICASRGIYVD